MAKLNVNNEIDRAELLSNVEDAVLKSWESRRFAQGYKFSYKRTAELQAEFILGMVATLDYLLDAEKTRKSSITPKIFFGIMRGEYIKS